MEKQKLEESLKRINSSIFMAKTITKDDRNSLKIQKTISNLKWEKEKILQQLEQLD